MGSKLACSSGKPIGFTCLDGYIWIFKFLVKIFALKDMNQIVLKGPKPFVIHYSPP